jgi:hypothetical protein
MRAVDDAVLARLDAVPFEIKDGFFDARPDSGTVIVTYALPYAVYYSSVGDDDEDTRRLSAHIPRESVFFSLTYVGLDRRQTKAAGEHIRAQLRRWRPTVVGYRAEVVQLLESQRVRRDDEAIRPDGAPLFYGVDNYAVGVRPSA